MNPTNMAILCFAFALAPLYLLYEQYQNNSKKCYICCAKIDMYDPPCVITNEKEMYQQIQFEGKWYEGECRRLD